MVLVFYIALVITIILLIMLVLVFVICISKLELQINNLNINNTNKRNNNKDTLIRISFKIGKWSWLKIKLNKEKIVNLYVKVKKYEIKKKADTNQIKEKIEKEIELILSEEKIRKEIISTKIEVEKFNLKLAFGTEDYIFTSYVIALVSIAISNILPHIISPKEDLSRIIHYRIVPIYKDKTLYNLHLSFTATTKILHLINIILKVRKLESKLV